MQTQEKLRGRLNVLLEELKEEGKDVELPAGITATVTQIRDGERDETTRAFGFDTRLLTAMFIKGRPWTISSPLLRQRLGSSAGAVGKGKFPCGRLENNKATSNDQT